MVINPQAFSTTQNGRQQTTDGLWLHRGPLLLNDVTGTYASMGGGGQPQFMRQLAINVDVPPLSSLGWQDGHMQLISGVGDAVRIGFHESGSSALALYKPPGSQNQLRVRGNDGTDYALAGAAGTAQQLIGSYVGVPDWTLPQGGVLIETPVQCNCTFTGTLVRFEFAFLASIPTKGARLYWQLMLDGAPGVTGTALGAIDAPEAAYAATVSGVYYWPQPPPGSHRIGLGMLGPSGSRLHPQALTVLYVTEQRI